MKIAKIETGDIRIPLKTPFKTALRTAYHIDDVIVRITCDTGEVGYGEAPPTAVITGDTKASIKSAIEDFIAPHILGRDIEELDLIFAALDAAMVHNTSAKAAVDMALYDLFGQRCGLPLYKLLGGQKNALETNMTISVNDEEEMVADSQRAVGDGFRILKIKVGKQGDQDIQLVRAIREAVGPDILLRVDANQGWEAKQAVRIIRALEDLALDIELVEQPVKASDMDGLRHVTQNVSTPILADEAVFGLRDAVEIVRTRAADLINIKLMKAGGIHQALKICALAEEYGVECMIGCMLESKLAVSAAAHLAAAKGVITRADLDGPACCAVDPYPDGPVFDGASITLSDVPGIGITSVPGFA